MEHRSSRSPLCRKTSESPVKNKPLRIFPNPFLNFLKEFRKLYKHKLSVIEITKRGDRHQNTDIEGERERETAGVVAGKEGEGVIQEHGPLRSRLKRMRVSKDVGERRKKKYCRGQTRKQEEKEKSGNRKCECRSSRCRKDHESRSDDDDSPAKRS
ncbi:hypothetical protein JTB14_014245 [Gonioctena quinquepunctata]|nr:hypothetical protein JTB14_014245 [Gonioctena quinquepunctata]